MCDHLNLSYWIDAVNYVWRIWTRFLSQKFNYAFHPLKNYPRHPNVSIPLKWLNAGSKEYDAIDIGFSFIAPFLHSIIGFGEKSASETIFILYSDIVNQIRYTKLEREKNRIEEVVTCDNIRPLRILARKLIKEFINFNSFRFKFHLFYHIMNDVSRFGAHNVLYVPPFENFVYFFKKFIIMTSMQRGITLEVGVHVIISAVAAREERSKTGEDICKRKACQGRYNHRSYQNCNLNSVFFSRHW